MDFDRMFDDGRCFFERCLIKGANLIGEIRSRHVSRGFEHRNAEIAPCF
jgi:hypothetical protein